MFDICLYNMFKFVNMYHIHICVVKFLVQKKFMQTS